MADKKGTPASQKALTKAEGEEIVQKFQQLRNEQRSLMAKITELEQDLNEHKWVAGVRAWAAVRRAGLTGDYLWR